MMAMCSVVGCGKVARACGYCDTHYRRVRKHGDASVRKNVKHGMYGTREYRSWQSMLARCYSESHKSYPDYGGRGIVVCDRCRESFENFYADMGPRPAGTSLERKKSSGNYGPDNCTWATPKRQARNKRDTRYVVIDGREVALADLAEKHGLQLGTVRARLRRGWPVERLCVAPTN